ncbi:hypothetical protein V9T40_014422 [Parthenolecanium corni]|uniref:LRRNT domain-containing protein n=1 Tax=Parthenolecanium corni TaxID=536013 RepID=A0AAN9XXH4_9HEMI
MYEEDFVPNRRRFVFGFHLKLFSSYVLLCLLWCNCNFVGAKADGSNGDNNVHVSKISGQPIIGRAIAAETTTLLKCPKSCTCTSTTIDCSNRGFQSMPRNLPTNVERL